MVTVELAVAIPVVLAVLAVALSALGAGLDEVRCLDGARAAARLAARGEPPDIVRAEAARLGPQGLSVAVTQSGDLVRVEVTAPVPRLLRVLGVAGPLEGHASARLESGLG